MSLSGQSGIDILCDAAAGSDVLPPLAPQTQHTPRSHPPAAAPSHPSPHLPPIASPAKSAKRKPPVSPPPRSGPSHVCHICSRVYERADHLTRHLRAHENARPYQCSRCPKRFNRADLLTRHEATHDRDGGEPGRSFIRRSDRASEACTNCAASKAKCEDEKPCRRCRNRNLPCSGRVRRAASQGAVSTPESTAASSITAGQELPGAPPSTAQARTYDTEMSRDIVSSDTLYSGGQPYYADPSRQTMSRSAPGAAPPLPAALGVPSAADTMAYLDTSQNPFQGLDFSSWDLNFDDLGVPPYELLGPSPSSASSAGSKTSSTRAIMRDPARGHEAFKRSPWLWEPEPEDYVRLEKEGLSLREDVARGLKFGGLSKALYNKIRMSSAMRDRVFALVLEQQSDQLKVPSFPSLGLLNYILLLHFTQEERRFDSWIHIGSFDPSSLPIFIASILAHGAMFVPVPAIWQFGMAIHEVVRVGLGPHFDSRNIRTRDLVGIQTYMLSLDVGLWSGIKRKMELAEGFICPLITMIRRAGSFTLPADSEDTIPTAADDKEVLDGKWKDFIKRESYKRLVLHIFFHDACGSMLLCTHPLISFTELRFSLPASKDLWMASSAEQWRDLYAAKLRAAGSPPQIPNISEILHNQDAIAVPDGLVDKDLCLAALLYSFRSRISSYWEFVKLHSSRRPPIPDPIPDWLYLQHKDTYHHLSDLTTRIAASFPSPHLRLASELTVMTLHVSLDDLQSFAGKAGEAEAHKVSDALDQHWATTPTARHAVFRAGQVLRLARLLPPASLRDFSAVAVYYASLTLWIYGLLRAEEPGEGGCVLVDGEDTPATRAFLAEGGVPGVRIGDRAVALGSDGAVLGQARAIMRENYPIKEEAVPPLVESLGALMMELAGDGKA